jgi:hypothetical protein
MTSPQQHTKAGARVRHFLMPKSGHSASECEDAIGIGTRTSRFAIADGATEAFDSSNWAKQLAHHWVELGDTLSATEFWSWLEEEGRALSESWQNLQLPWYAEEKAHSGSFAAFVGVELDLESLPTRWKGIALGDSCMFQFRQSTLLTVMPAMEVDSFSSTPSLSPSRTSLQPGVLEKIVVNGGELERGDILLLCSDALAAWVLGGIEQGSVKRFSFDRLFNSSETDLGDFFEQERSTGQLKDDDIALVILEV